MESVLDKIKFKKQPIIKVDGGDVLKVMKKSSFSNFNFQEVYFSFINYNYVKGWKLQRKMTSNLSVPLGEVKFVFVTEDFKNSRIITLSEKNFGILTIPPNIWYGFKGLGKEKSLILNLCDHEHNDKEVKKINMQKFPLKIKI